MAEQAAANRKVFRIGLRIRFTGWLVLLTAVIMIAVLVIVRQEMETTLEDQIKARGLVMARNLAASCVEPMQLPAERMLSLMLLSKEYVQTGGGPEVVRRLAAHDDPRARDRGMWPMVWEYVKRFGREVTTEGAKNEGVLSATVVDSTGVVAAFSDAIKPQEDWFEAIDQPYQPHRGASVLAAGEGYRIWQSPDRSGIYVIAAPIAQQAVADGAVTDETEGEGEVSSAAPAGYGAVYLTMSRDLVNRAVARAVAYLLIVAVGVLAVSVLIAMIIAGALSSPMRLLQTGVQAIATGDFGRRISLRRSDEIGELTDAFNEMAKGLAERETMRGAFSTFVSPELLQEIVKNPDALKVGGSRRVATSMFCYFANHYDLGGLAERFDPETLVSNINDYLGIEARTVSEHGGYLDKFIGDVVLAVWGVPLETTDHAIKAVACAVDIQKRVADFNKRRTGKDAMITTISIGINTGPLVAGNMGSEGTKLDYTVIGEDVNFAARLAGAGATLHGGSIWIGQNTFGLVKDMVEFKDLGNVEFKGLGPRPVVEVAGVRSARPPGAP